MDEITPEKKEEQIIVHKALKILSTKGVISRGEYLHLLDEYSFVK